MADYFSISELLQSTDNMTYIRNNVGNDSGTDTIPGVSWFTYNSVTAENIYVNGNSWMGIGTNGEQVVEIGEERVFKFAVLGQRLGHFGPVAGEVFKEMPVGFEFATLESKTLEVADGE